MLAATVLAALGIGLRSAAPTIDPGSHSHGLGACGKTDRSRTPGLRHGYLTISGVLSRARNGGSTVPSVRIARRFSGWLDRRTPWQFALTWAACLFLVILIVGGTVQWLIRGSFDLAFLFGFTGSFAVLPVLRPRLHNSDG